MNDKTRIELIVGLGNPGKEYAQTRHNAGFWFVERIAQKYNINLKNEAKYFGMVGKGNINGREVRLLMPTTFMNKSGQSIQALAQFFQIPVSAILVAHDELDMPAGQVKLKTGGGHGGHNGLRDTVPRIGADFLRCRIGIGHPGARELVTGHVLGKAPSAEQQLMDDAIVDAVNVVPLLVDGDIAAAMNALNRKK